MKTSQKPYVVFTPKHKRFATLEEACTARNLYFWKTGILVAVEKK